MVTAESEVTEHLLAEEEGGSRGKKAVGILKGTGRVEREGRVRIRRVSRKGGVKVTGNQEDKSHMS